MCPNFRWHDDVIKWKHFPRYWPFVRGIHRPPVNSPHKGQWRGALMFTLICARINVWVNNREAGDLRRNRVHYDVIVMDLTAWQGNDDSPTKGNQMTCPLFGQHPYMMLSKMVERRICGVIREALAYQYGDRTCDFYIIQLLLRTHCIVNFEFCGKTLCSYKFFANIISLINTLYLTNFLFRSYDFRSYIQIFEDKQLAIMVIRMNCGNCGTIHCILIARGTLNRKMVPVFDKNITCFNLQRPCVFFPFNDIKSSRWGTLNEFASFVIYLHFQNVRCSV